MSHTTTLMVTHRYQDGNLMANFRYNPDSGESGAGPITGRTTDSSTIFMVLQEGRLVFEGTRRNWRPRPIHTI